ncbi:MAG: carboxypeptidase-like regulatory domain-containing protein [Chitinophagales bacterium]|nr:carboxypeptidase-like regulatory domain-containing protein [Chitinophagales bacterium]
MRRVLVFALGLLLPDLLAAQLAYLYGTVRDETGNPLASVAIRSTGNKIAFTNDQGAYELAISAGREVVVQFSHVGYESFERRLTLQPGQRFPLYVVLTARVVIMDSLVVQDDALRQEAGMARLSVKSMELLPSAGGGVEAMLRMIGAQSNNELSSQYSVRGGNYDENLVYVNDFEIFRPLLIRSSQQEGLSFVNVQLVDQVHFSTGGFQARYGDKMSSVLDVLYRRPERFAAQVEASLLGGAASLEGVAAEKRLRYLAGARYKTSRYLLGTLDVRGEYQPNFSDVQANLQYDFSPNWTLEALAHVSANAFRFIPENRVTTFGTIQRTLRLTMFFDGQELDRYVYGMGGLSLRWRANERLSLKALVSGYRTREEETYDLIGQYFLGEVSNNFGQEDFGQTLYYLGVGTEHQWARNFLSATLIQGSFKGTYTANQHTLRWGLDVSKEQFDDRLSEWTRVDSAGYTLPYSDQIIQLQEVIRAGYRLSGQRLSAYVQDSWQGLGPWLLTGGLRLSYWSVNRQWLVSPRLQAAYTPLWRRDVVFRFAVGAYNQPPFYRELRDLNGQLHPEVRAQRSVHFVAGMDYRFLLWNRPFSLISELYYKHLFDLNPYELDNVRIRYFGSNEARGYAAGMDVRVNGEFVPGAESWVSLSLLRTREDLLNDFFYELDTAAQGPSGTEWDTTVVYPGFIPRPTDQLVNFALFFQDYLPGNDRFKVHLNLLFGTGLPTGPPDHIRARDTIRLAPYRRVDIGFSFLLHDASRPHMREASLWRHIRSAWLSLEVFNLLGVSNEIGFTWVKDYSNLVYAVPNFLTGRRLNLRLQVAF